MNELDEIWSKMLSQALANAKASGRHDVADYLTLKATNDAIRRASTAWLFDTAVELASEANRNNASISIEREDQHNFAFRGSNMVGSLLRVRRGVRCLTIEAGWTRTPTDGFMRGGALAFARITHLGMAKQNAELVLQNSNGHPIWYILRDDKAVDPFKSVALLSHFRVFLDG